MDGPCKRWLGLQTAPPIGHLREENVSRITQLLKDSDHLRETLFFPARVLDLEAQSPQLRLVTRDEVLEKGLKTPDYVALSYCWGTTPEASKQSMTTSSNLRERKANIDIQTVSVVIRDAVTVCRTFRIRYLWVDALCIIQDDILDWERESSIMGVLYRSAYFTIGAASSESCDQSFLDISLPVIELPFSSSLDSGVKGTYRITARGDSDGNGDAVNAVQDLNGSWMKRGWVVQERFLAHRLLIFGGNMVHAEFGQKTATLPRITSTDLSYYTWRGLMKDYSSCQIGFNVDKLPAISGLAELFADALEDQYNAGLWKKDMFRILFWYVSIGVYDPTRIPFAGLLKSLEAPRPYVAPSWSFLRQDKCIWFRLSQMNGGEDSQPQCEIVDARCYSNGSNLYGTISGGFLVISAKTCPLDVASLAPMWPTNLIRYRWAVTPSLEVCLDWDPEPEIICENGFLLMLLGSFPDPGVGSCGCEDKSDAPSAFYQTILYEDEDECLNETDSILSDGPDTEFCHTCFVAPENHCAYGLLLYPAKEAGNFYRVGVFSTKPKRARPFSGGLNLCDSWETQTLRII
ncbi:hypothetical protein PVAG01_08878 [Phlyctema vagabunda]|uniref:Heterokaryon incompatibility domain-containing protein n=1 Tax=Phlyctema vagabunda TaxID=108571 RepID=A0ABR4PAN7_9HELO